MHRHGERGGQAAQHAIGDVDVEIDELVPIVAARRERREARPARARRRAASRLAGSTTNREAPREHCLRLFLVGCQ